MAARSKRPNGCMRDLSDNQPAAGTHNDPHTDPTPTAGFLAAR
jgi:hypothetical protein